MATDIAGMALALTRQVSLTGAERLPDLTSTERQGHILDGFWTLKLKGVFSAYTVLDGADLDPPATGTFIGKTSNHEDLPPESQRLVVMMATFNLIRLAILNLAVNIRAHAGPVEFEQQASATTLRAILQSLEEELAQMQALHSSSIGPGAFYYMDGVLQAEYSLVNSLASLTVLP